MKKSEKYVTPKGYIKVMLAGCKNKCNKYNRIDYCITTYRFSATEVVAGIFAAEFN